MSQDETNQIKKLSERIDTVLENQDRILIALLGDALEGKNGIIHYHNQMVEDNYGIGPDGKPIEGKRNTVLNRISQLEGNQSMIKWVITGVVGFGIAMKVGLIELIGKVFK